MSEPQISVVIPSYNRRESLFALLRDVFAQEGIPFEVIVTDDCSPDGTADAVAAEFPLARVLRNETNSGPCVARNRGVRAARAEIVVGLDSDVTVPDRHLLRRIFDEFRARPEATAFSLRILKPDGRTEDSERWWHPLPIEKFAARWFETDYFCGTGCAFRRSAIVAAGLYPEVLYMHYEEVELAFRLIDRGGRIFHAPDLAVRHHASPVADRGRITKFYKPRNQILLAVQCLPWTRAVAYLAPRLAYNFLAAVRRGYVGEYLQALGSARKLARVRLASRDPLKPGTFRRLAEMRRQAPELSPAP